MIGGLAVQNNLLCVTGSMGRGHVFLYDLDARERISTWSTPVGPSGYSDAGGVAIDARFRIYVADPSNACLRRYNAFGQHLGDVGLPLPSTGDRGRDKLGVLDRPHAVACPMERLWVTAGDRPRRRGVQCFDVHGKALRSLSAQGEAGTKWAAPRGVCCDERGLVVADTLRGRLQLFRPGGTFMQERSLPSGAAARPGAVARLPSGAVVVVDHGGVEAALVGLAADGAQVALPGLDGEVRDPVGLATDPRGRLLVLDEGGDRVLRWSADRGEPELLVDLSGYGDGGFSVG
ncbi:MAG: hypothetical protein VXY92_09835 [Planctomycetota bacterium]|nr:hypothetical protein [Planctomycetota bacterium]